MTKTFRSSVLAIVVQLALVYWGLTFLRRAYFLLAEERWVPIYSSTLIGGTLVILVASIVAAWWYRVDISTESIKGPNLWGGFSTISLFERFQFKEVGIPGFRYLKIIGGEKSSIWITLPVGNQSELLARLEASSEENT